MPHSYIQKDLEILLHFYIHILVVVSKTIVVSHSQVYSQCKYILVNFTASRITLEKEDTVYSSFICALILANLEMSIKKQT